MKLIRLYLVPIIFSLSFFAGFGQKKTSTSEDFKRLVGCWQGSLTYLDYSSGKPFTMAANMDITAIAGTQNFTFSNSYPKEPHANSIDTLVISDAGKTIDQAMVRSRKKLTNGDVQIITESPGKDGNDDKPAIFRHTYIFSKSNYSNKKEVQFTGTSKWITRSEYSYKRCK